MEGYEPVSGCGLVLLPDSAHEIPSVVGTPLALPAGNFGINTQWPRANHGLRRVVILVLGGDDSFGRNSLLDPPHQSCKHMPLRIEYKTWIVARAKRTRIVRRAKCVRAGSSPAVLHARRHKKSVEIAVVASQVLFYSFVVANRIFGRNHRISPAVVLDDLLAVGSYGAEVRIDRIENCPYTRTTVCGGLQKVEVSKIQFRITVDHE